MLTSFLYFFSSPGTGLLCDIPGIHKVTLSVTKVCLLKLSPIGLGSFLVFVFSSSVHTNIKHTVIRGL